MELLAAVVFCGMVLLGGIAFCAELFVRWLEWRSKDGL